MKYILNSAVITAEGTYEYKHITPAEAITWIHGGEWESTIGYPETAMALAKIIRGNVPVNRKVITMQAGDEALVFRLVFPQGYRPDPSQKGSMGVDFILANCEIGMLRRLK
jgi:hypothetical protein